MLEQAVSVSQSVNTSCRYISTGHAGKFYVICCSCNAIHGVLSKATKTLVPFVNRAEAERVCKLLNRHGGVVC